MKRIELVGPPGVGKTTLLNKVLIECKRNKINTSRQLDIPIAYNIDGYYLFKFIYKFKNYLPSKIIGPANAYFSERFVRYELENVSLDNKWSQLIDFYFTNLQKPSKHMKRIRQFNQSISIASYVDRQNSDEIVLFDEGLFQRGFSLGYSEVEDEVLHKYYYYVPEPDLIIFMYGSDSTIKKRLINRDGENSEFTKLVKRSQDISKILLNVLKFRETNMVQINTDDSLDKQLEILIKKVQSLRN